MQVVLSVIDMLVDLSVAIMQVTVSVPFMQLEVSVVLVQVKASTANMWANIFIVIMQVESGLQLCKWYFLQCIMHMTVSIQIMQMTVFIIAM